jgi:DNA-binding MarR family transcriptional regulator
VRHAIVGLVRHDGPDLSARQLGVLLISYLDDAPQTVSRLAVQLNVSMPTVSRAIDRLSEFDLVRRKNNPSDRRSVLVQRTIVGAKFLSDLRSMLGTARVAAQRAPGGRSRQAGKIGVAV